MSQLGMLAAAKGLDTVQTGLGINYLRNKQQLKFDKQYQDMQIEGQKEMGLYNQNLALDTWNKTNYEAQRKHMEAAGLNPGLLYGMGGTGGATTNTAPGNVSSGHATPSPNIQGMGLQTIAQIKLLEAQKENIEADTANKKQNTATGAATEIKTNAEITNIEANTILTNFKTQSAKIESEIATEGKSLQIGTLNANMDKIRSEADIALNNKTISDATYDDIIKQAEQTTINLGLQGALTEINISKDKATITKLGADILQGWENLRISAERNKLTDNQIQIQAGQLALNKITTEFQTGNIAEAARITKMFTDIFNTVNNAKRKGGGIVINN